MFSELDGFVDDNSTNHIDENSNEENDVDEETMSGKLSIKVNFVPRIIFVVTLNIIS